MGLVRRQGCGWGRGIGRWGLSLCAVVATVTPAHAAWLDSEKSPLDQAWLAIAAILVFTMQIGFLFLEAGTVRSKNSINVAMKNFVDFVLTTLIFAAIGFSLMFGTSIGGVVGWSGALVFPDFDNVSLATFFLFQVMFCGTASTIVSGAVAERMKFDAYLLYTLLIAGFIYPIVGHWAWGGLLTGAGQGWLEALGYIDFAGSSVVHIVGGVCSLAALIVIGPRIGRFTADGQPVRIQGHSPVLTMAGILLLWVGWLGFNAGGTTVGSVDFGRALVNTLLAGAAGSCAAMVVGRLQDGYYMPERTSNGLIGGLVAITAGCLTATSHGALLTGIAGGLTAILGQDLIERRWKLDDAVGAVAVHALAGMVGILAVPWAAAAERLPHDRWHQFLVQGTGAVAIAVFTFLLCWPALLLARRWGILRISREEELAGLNQSEHHARLGTGELQAVVTELSRGDADLSSRVRVEEGDESADLAHAFNGFLDRLEADQRRIDEELITVHARADLENARRQRMEVERAAAEEARLREEAREASRRAARLESLLGSFDATVAQAVETLLRASSALDGTAGRLSADVARTSSDASSALDGARDALDNATAVAAATEQLADSTRSIAEQMDMVREVTVCATEAGQEGVRLIESLRESATSISSVVDFIQSVAHESNLLALNASIEAARAGEAGQGFAVVAREVKGLSHQTAQAAQTVMAQIEGIGSAVDLATRAMTSIAGSIERTEAAALSVASSTSQQGDATADINRRAADAAATSSLLRERIGSLSAGAQSVETSADEVRNAAAALTETARILSAALDTEFKQFRARVVAT